MFCVVERKIYLDLFTWWIARRIHAEHFGSEEIAEVSCFFSLFFNNNARNDFWSAHFGHLGQYFLKVNWRTSREAFQVTEVAWLSVSNMDAISVRQPHRMIIKNMRSCTKLFITVCGFRVEPECRRNVFIQKILFWNKSIFLDNRMSRNRMKET